MKRTLIAICVPLATCNICFAEEATGVLKRPGWVERCLELKKLDEPKEEPTHTWSISPAGIAECQPAPGTATPLLTSGWFGISSWGRNHVLGAPLEVCIGERRGSGRRWERLYAAVVFRSPPAPRETQAEADDEGEDSEPAVQEASAEPDEEEVFSRKYLVVFYIRSDRGSRLIASFPVTFATYFSAIGFCAYRAHAVRTWFEPWPLFVLTSGLFGKGQTFVYRVSENGAQVACLAEISTGWRGTLGDPIERSVLDFSELTTGTFRRFTVYDHELLQGWHETCARTTYTWQGRGYRPDKVVVSLRTYEDWPGRRGPSASAGVGMSATLNTAPGSRLDQPVGGEHGDSPRK